METQLYLPVKRFVEARGFAVKGEICGCDLGRSPLSGIGGNSSAVEEYDISRSGVIWITLAGSD
jgi:hypothetical protein